MRVIINIPHLFGCYESFNTSKKHLYIYFTDVPDNIDNLDRTNENFFNELTSIVQSLSKQIAKK